MLWGLGRVGGVRYFEGGVAVDVTDDADRGWRWGIGFRWRINALDDVGYDDQVASGTQSQPDCLATPDLLCAEIHAVVVSQFLAAFGRGLDALEKGICAVNGFGGHDGGIDRRNALAILTALESPPVDLVVAEVGVLLEIRECTTWCRPGEPRFNVVIGCHELLGRGLVWV